MKHFTKLLILVTLLVGGFAVAQSKNDEDVLKDVKNMSHGDMISGSNAMIKDMRSTLDATQLLLEQLRDEESDILTLNCINEHLAAIKGFLKVSEQQQQNLKDQDTRESQEHSFTLISVSAAKVQTLGEEAQNCIGEGQRFADSTDIERREDPDIANIDVIEEDDDAFDDAFAAEKEPELTPFQ